MEVINGIFSYIAEYPDVFAGLIVRHLQLVFSSSMIAILTGVILGIIAAKTKVLSKIILAVANVIQSIPELVMLALGIPLLGVGFVPTFTVLLLKAVLPVIMNTYVGIRDLDPSVLEAAKGIGMTEKQRLFRVELPLSAPAILTGCRIALVRSVAIATLGSFIGGGGLGDWIQQGMTMYNYSIIFAGAIPVTLLALLLDVVSAKLIKHATPLGIR